MINALRWEVNAPKKFMRQAQRGIPKNNGSKVSRGMYKNHIFVCKLVYIHRNNWFVRLFYGVCSTTFLQEKAKWGLKLWVRVRLFLCELIIIFWHIDFSLSYKICFLHFQKKRSHIPFMLEEKTLLECLKRLLKLSLTFFFICCLNLTLSFCSGIFKIHTENFWEKKNRQPTWTNIRVPMFS